MMSWYHKNNLAPFYESHLDVVRGLLNQKVSKKSVKKKRWSERHCYIDKNKRIFFMPLPST